jgi:enterochelin esterase-like enzyme
MNDSISPATLASPQETVAVASGLRFHELSSRVFGNTRKLRVWLPPGYEAPQNASRRYPVFYLNDGQNLFDPATAFAGVDWRVGESAARLIAEGVIPPLIVVGIDNATVERFREYMPYRTLRPLLLQPFGKRYPEFLLEEVMPLIEREYRVAGGAENTGLGGSSLGAIISLYTAMARRGVIGKLLLESPSLFVSSRQLLKLSRGVGEWPQRVFLAIGTNESDNLGRDRMHVRKVRALERILQRAGLDHSRLLVNVEENAGHNEGAWAHRFPQALAFLFGR